MKLSGSLQDHCVYTGFEEGREVLGIPTHSFYCLLNKQALIEQNSVKKCYYLLYIFFIEYVHTLSL